MSDRIAGDGIDAPLTADVLLLAQQACRLRARAIARGILTATLDGRTISAAEYDHAADVLLAHYSHAMHGTVA